MYYASVTSLPIKTFVHIHVSRSILIVLDADKKCVNANSNIYVVGGASASSALKISRKNKELFV